jgi:hypothetical protein
MLSFAAREQRQQGARGLAQVADEGDVGADVLVDLGGVDLDVDLLGVGRVAGEVAGDAVVEAHAEAMSRSACWMASLTHDSPCMPIMPSESGCAAGKPPRPSSVLATGICWRSAKASALLACAGLQDAVAGEDDRALGGADELDGFRMLLSIRREHGVRAVGFRLGGFEVEGRGGLLRVLGDVDQHRPGAAGLCDLEGLANGRRDVFRAGDEEVVLGDGQRDAGDVDFLESVGAEDFARDLAGDADDGDGVEHGGGDAGDEVGGAGAAGRDADADLGHARGARVASRPCARRPARGARGCGGWGNLRSAS